MTAKPRLRATNDGRLIPVTDSLQNLVSGLGTRSDKRSHNQFVYANNWMDFGQLEAAYTENWIARQIVDVPTEDAFREWRTFQCAQAQDIENEEKRLGLVAKYTEGRKWSKLYGGATLLMVTDQPMDQPLNVNAIKRGGLHRLVVLDRWEIQPQLLNFTDPIAENYLLPEYYQVRGGNYRIHHSHLIRLDGESLPRRVRALNEGWGDSRLRQVLDDLKDLVASRSGIATMIQESNVDVVTRDGLSSELASDEEANVLKRFALGAQMKSLVNMLLLDGEESYERKQLSFSGLEGILDKFMIWISGAAEIPMTRLFGRSAAGMNATGEGDLTNYYDGLSAQQETHYRPELERLDQVMIRSALGEMPEECEWQWNPLYQESGTELAQQELAHAQANEIYYQQRTLKRSHILMRLKGEGKYAITDEEIDAIKAQEELEDGGDFDDDLDDGLLTSNTKDKDFNESKIKRDPDGKFSSSGGGSTAASNPSTKVSGGNKSTQIGEGSYEENIQTAKELGYNTESVFVHRSGSKEIGEIKETGNFPGLFSLEESESDQADNYGRYEYKYVIKGDPWDSSDIQYAVSDDYHGAESFIKSKLPGRDEPDEDTLESIMDIAINEDFSDAADNEDIMNALGAIDEADLYKEMQSIRAQLAKHLGAPAIRMTDEFSGDTIMILPGENAMQVSSPSKGG